ncbi:MAG: LmbE family protein [Fibrobacteres bacterium]|nr:LmbE family protein [Fibrobacterota bacterium]
MAIGAHPDDIELGCGGTLLRLASLGKRGVLVDMTDASMGTRGTPEIRAREAKAAAKVLKAERVNLGLPDGRLADGWEAQKRLIDQIRHFRPKVVITHHWREEHPDHELTSRIVKQAVYKSGLAKLDVAGAPHRPGRLFYFVGVELHEPSFCVDITPFWDAKLKAVLCYKSQFHNPKAKAFKGKTDLASPEFMEFLTIRNRFWGSRIKRRYAEAFVSTELPEVHDLTALGGERFA